MERISASVNQKLLADSLLLLRDYPKIAPVVRFCSNPFPSEDSLKANAILLCRSGYVKLSLPIRLRKEPEAKCRYPFP